MTSRKVVMNKSTVPVGMADEVAECIAAGLAARGAEISFEVCSNPEFLKEGSAVADALRPDRIIISARSQATMAGFRRMYESFNRNHDKMMFMDPRSAELTKYAAKAMLPPKSALLMKSRISQRRWAPMLSLCARAWDQTPALATSSFTPVRAMAALASPRMFRRWRPEAIYGPRDDMHYCATKEQALDDADCLVICTEWKLFRAPDFEDIKCRLTSPLIIDGRNLYNPEDMEAAGIEHFGIGRGRSVTRT